MRHLAMALSLILAMTLGCRDQTASEAEPPAGTEALAAPTTQAPAEPTTEAAPEGTSLPEGGPIRPTSEPGPGPATASAEPLAAQQGPVATAWRLLDDELDIVQQVQQALAEVARNQLGSGLAQRLTAVMADEGPAAAIAVCNTDAPRIAGETAAAHGLRIGRTSHRLRNPDNTPPDWALASVERRLAQPAFFVGPQGQLGALYPIRLAEMCTTCHGQPEQIPDDVRSALAERYPTDQATGFAPGDLRGWFWVEVPGEE